MIYLPIVEKQYVNVGDEFFLHEEMCPQFMSQI